MTDLEIDRLIKNYHYELKGCVDLLENIDKTEQRDFLNSIHINLKFGCFVISSFIDLLSTLKGINKASSDWEYIYYSRIGYLLIYETINTYHKHKKTLKETIDSEQTELIEHYAILNSLLKEYKHSYDFDNMMSKIRNKTIAHFDKDFFEYYNYFEELNSPNSKKAIEDFLDFFKYLLYFTNGLNGGEIKPNSRDI